MILEVVMVGSVVLVKIREVLRRSQTLQMFKLFKTWALDTLSNKLSVRFSKIEMISIEQLTTY
jgi:hypothetical protein